MQFWGFKTRVCNYAQRSKVSNNRYHMTSMTWGFFKDALKHRCISGSFPPEWGMDELWGRVRWSRSSRVFLNARWSKRHFWARIHVCVSVRRACVRERKDVSENEWEDGARLVCRFRSTFSWKEESRCFPLWPWLTVWIHYAFRGALVQKSAQKPPRPPANPSIGPTFIILTFPLGGGWGGGAGGHQSRSSPRPSVWRRTCHPHSVSGRLLACTRFVVSED